MGGIRILHFSTNPASDPSDSNRATNRMSDYRLLARQCSCGDKGGKKLDDFLIDESAQKGRKKRRSKR
jgi:hypothetical protein